MASVRGNNESYAVAAAVPTEPIPIVPIAKATIPLKVNPVNKLKPVNKGKAFALFALFAALGYKKKTNSAINATIERGWKSLGLVAMSETPAKTPKEVRTIPAQGKAF